MKKSTTVAYLFFFFLGAHYFYLGNWVKQIFFWLTLGGLGLWWLIDLFTLSSKVSSHNTDIEFKKIQKINKQTTEMMQASASQQMASVLGKTTKNLEE